MALQKCRRDALPNLVSTMTRFSNSSVSAVMRSMACARMALFPTLGIWNRRLEEHPDRHCHRTLRKYLASSVESTVQEKRDDLSHVYHHGGSPQRIGKRRSHPRRALARSRRLFLRGERP